MKHTIKGMTGRRRNKRKKLSRTSTSLKYQVGGNTLNNAPIAITPEYIEQMKNKQLALQAYNSRSNVPVNSPIGNYKRVEDLTVGKKQPVTQVNTTETVQSYGPPTLKETNPQAYNQQQLDIMNEERAKLGLGPSNNLDPTKNTAGRKRSYGRINTKQVGGELEANDGQETPVNESNEHAQQLLQGQEGNPEGQQAQLSPEVQQLIQQLPPEVQQKIMNDPELMQLAQSNPEQFMQMVQQLMQEAQQGGGQQQAPPQQPQAQMKTGGSINNDKIFN